MGTTLGVPIPCDHQTLGCGWKRSLGEAFVVPQERTLLTIMLSDFLVISRAAKPLSYPQNTARAGAGPSLAEQHSRAQRSGQFPAGLHHTTNQGKQNVLFQASFFFSPNQTNQGLFCHGSGLVLSSNTPKQPCSSPGSATTPLARGLMTQEAELSKPHVSRKRVKGLGSQEHCPQSCCQQPQRHRTIW